MNYARVKLFGIFLIQCIFMKASLVGGANILGVFTTYSPSHLIINMSVAKVLADRGHNVTVLTTYPPKVTHKNIHVITMPLSAEKQKKLDTHVGQLTSASNNVFNKIKHVFLVTIPHIMEIQYSSFNCERLHNFLNTPDTHFDLVIMGYFRNEYQLGIGAHFKAPVIITWTAPLLDAINDFVGNPHELSYIPNINMAIKSKTQLNFTQRLLNLLFRFFFNLTYKFAMHRNNIYYKEIFKNENLPSLDEMTKNISMVFASIHFSDGIIRPNVPAIIEIGGIQVKDKPDPLPKDILEYIENSTHGVILFSLGSNIKANTLDKKIANAIFNTLSNLKENIIWKWDDLDNVPGRAENILYKTWLPQDDILAHPKTKLFITHAGKGSTVEAQYHAVPMVALPVFADQNTNALAMQEAGYGLYVELLKVTEDKFKTIVTNVLNNSTYKENAQRFSNLYRDRPITARENVIFWSEYVMRHHGAPHIQSPLIHMNFIEVNNIDVFAVLLLTLIIIFKLVKLIFKFLIKFCKKQQNPKKKTKKH